MRYAGGPDARGRPSFNPSIPRGAGRRGGPGQFQVPSDAVQLEHELTTPGVPVYAQQYVMHMVPDALA